MYHQSYMLIICCYLLVALCSESLSIMVAMGTALLGPYKQVKVTAAVI